MRRGIRVKYKRCAKECSRTAAQVRPQGLAQKVDSRSFSRCQLQAGKISDAKQQNVSNPAAHDALEGPS